MYVKGKKIPLDISIGRKERWTDKNHRLSAKNNPYKLDQDDREKLVLLASQSPEDKDRIMNFYHGDAKLEEMMGSSREFERINKKNAYWLQGGKGSASIVRLEDYKARGSNMTMEEWREYQLNDARARRERKEQLASESN